MNCASTGLVSRKSSVPSRTYSVIAVEVGLEQRLAQRR